MSDLVARLRLQADAGNTAQVMGGAETAVQGVGRASVTAASGLDRAAVADSRVNRELAETAVKGPAAGRGLDHAAGGAARFERSAAAARSAALLLGAGIAALTGRELVQNMSDAALTTQGWSMGLGAVAGGASGAAAEIAFLYQESDRLGLVVRDQVSSFLSLAGATNGTASAGRTTREVWLGMVEAGTVLGRSSEQQKRGLEALAQIASKGVVSMEELRGQMAEALPGATQIAARAMGMSSDALIKMVSDGKLASDVFLPKFAAQLRSEFGPALDQAMTNPLRQAGMALNDTKNDLFDLQAVAGEEFLVSFTEGVLSFNEALTDQEAREAARDLGKMLGEAAATGATALGQLITHVDEAVTVLQLLTALGVGRWFAEVGNAAIASGGKIVASSRATAAAQALEAKAARDAALAHEQAAMATLANAQAQLRASAASMTSTKAITAVAVAERELAAARVASTAAGVRADVAAVAGARSLTTLGGAGALAMRGLSGLSALLGGPLGIALMAVAGGAWAVSAALSESGRVADEVAEATGRYNTAMDQAETFLREAAVASTDFGKANAGAVSGTDALANATFRLASARAEAARQALNDAMAANEAEIQRIENPGFLSKAGEFLMSMGSGGDTWDGGATSVAEERSAKRKAAADRLRQQNNALLKKSIEIAVNPASNVPDAPAKDVHTAVADAADKRAKKTDAVREAERRLAEAGDLERSARMDTAALEARARAVGAGAAAVEALRVKQAGLDVLQRLEVETLDALTGKQREAAEAAMKAAEARERQAVATEKAEAVAKTTEDLDRQIASERGYATALAAGEKALADYTLAEAVRQEVERTGETLSAGQIESIRLRITELERLKAVTEGVSDQEAFKQELLLARMTADERQREQRVIELRNRYLRDGLAITEAEADARARGVEALENEQRRRAEDVGQLKSSLRAAYIESGELGFDKVADYAERKLREAVYDALLAKPIDMIINASVNVIGDALGKAFSAGSNGGSIFDTLAQVFGGGGPVSAATGKLDNVAGMLSNATSSLASLAPYAMAAVASNQLIGKAIGFDSRQQEATKWFGVVGGLLVGKESNHGARADFDGAGGFTIGGSKRNRQTTDAASGAANAIVDLVDSLKEIGVDAEGVISAIQVGTRDSSKIRLANGQTVTAPKGDMEALVKAAGKALLQNADFENPQMERMVDQMLAANKSFEDIAEKLGEFVAAQDLGDDLKLQLLKYTDPRAYTVESLEKAQKARREQVQDYAADGFYTDAQLAEILTTLDALEDAELADALERLGDAAGGAAGALAAAKPRLKEWLDMLGYKNAAQLNPFEERQLAMAQYEAQLEKARAGDADALASITATADRLLSADEEATSSAQERLALYNKIQADIAGLVALSAPVGGGGASLTAPGGATVEVPTASGVVAQTGDTDENAALIEAIDRLRADVNSRLDQLGDGMGGLVGEVGGELAGILRLVEGNSGLTIEALRDLIREGRLGNALAQAAASRVTQ